MLKRLEIEKQVKTVDCTENHNLRLLSLMNWFQEAADAHASKLGCGIEYCMQNGIAWVGRSYHIVIEELPKLHDKIKLTTWPSVRGKLTAFREFLLQDKAGKTLIKASSSWILIDIGKRRVLPLESLPVFENDDTRAVPTDFPKITDIENSEIETERNQVVRYDEIDLNKHVNNANYLLWAAEQVNQNGNRPHLIQIDFKKEATEETRIKIKTSLKGNESLHVICGRNKEEAEDKELCRIKILWDKKALLKGI